MSPDVLLAVSLYISSSPLAYSLSSSGVMPSVSTRKLAFVLGFSIRFAISKILSASVPPNFVMISTTICSFSPVNRLLSVRGSIFFALSSAFKITDCSDVSLSSPSVSILSKRPPDPFVPKTPVLNASSLYWFKICALNASITSLGFDIEDICF